MGASYTVDGYLKLDTARQEEYLPLLKKLSEYLYPEDYGYNPISGEFWIDCWAERSSGSIDLIEETLTELGNFAMAAAKLYTRCEDNEGSLWVGPSQPAVFQAKIADVQEEIGYLTRQLAQLAWETELWQMQQALS